MSDYTPDHAAKQTSPLLSNSTYDALKKVVTLGLPAFGTFYVTIAQIWGLPNPEGVAATCLALATFLGVVLNLAGRAYERSDAKYDGQLDVFDKEDGTKAASLVLKNYENPADIVKQNEVVFKVNSVSGQPPADV